ncbi:MAG: acyl-CoA dehydrogenase family protein, partial [Caldimonas sp.]
DGLKLLPAQAGRWQLEGAKTFASGAGAVSRALVTARDAAGGWQMAIVATDIAGVVIDRSFLKPLGMRSSASYKVDFGQVVIESADLLGAPGDYYREPAFGAGAVRFAAVQQGGIEAIFDATRSFLRRLGRIDDPYQRARLGEMAMCVASGRQWLRAAAEQAVAAIEQPADTSPTTAHAHLTRTAIESNALRVLQLAERSVGARGLLAPEPFERLHRDLTHYLRQAGPDAAIAAAGAYVLAQPGPAYALWNE